MDDNAAPEHITASGEAVPLQSVSPVVGLGYTKTEHDGRSPWTTTGTVVDVRKDIRGHPVVIEEINHKIVAYADDREIWDRQPDEPDNYWAWFTAFRDMDPVERTLANTYRLVTNKEICWKTPDTWQLAWNLWSWVERAQAYDRHVDAVHRSVLENARLKARVDTMNLGRGMREKAAEALIVLEAVVYQNIKNPDGVVERVMRSALTPSQIAKLAEVGVKLERLAVGEDDPGQFTGAGAGGITAVQVNVKIGDDELVKRAQAIIEARQGGFAARSE